MGLRRENLKMVGKLGVITLGMFAFGYALVPMYRAICNVLGLSAPSLPIPDSMMPMAFSFWSSARCRKKKSMGVRSPRGELGAST